MMNPSSGHLKRSYDYSEKEELKERVGVEQSIPMYQCGLCHVKFRSPIELINHVEKGEHYHNPSANPRAEIHIKEEEFDKDVSTLTIDLVSEEVDPVQGPSVIVRPAKVSDTVKESIPKPVPCPARTVTEVVQSMDTVITDVDEEPKNLVKREQEETYITSNNGNKEEPPSKLEISRPASPIHSSSSQAGFEISMLLSPMDKDMNAFYKCMKCSATFSSVISLKNHRSVHDLDCPVCGDSFYIKPSLDRHIREKHGDFSENASQPGTSSVTNFASDILIEPTSDGCYGCKICGKVCAARSDMSKHVRRHTDERPYSCSICSDKFKHRSAITNHMRIHTGEKPYTCVYCGKQFSQPSNKRRHEALHRGERPFNCDLCKRSFSEKTTLQTHMLQHTGERPFKCDVCGKGHITNSALTQHRRSRHQSVGSPHSPSDTSEVN